MLLFGEIGEIKTKKDAILLQKAGYILFGKVCNKIPFVVAKKVR